MVHRVVFRVASEEALDFWAERTGGSARVRRRRSSTTRKGSALELVVDESADEPLVAAASRDPDGARAARLRRRSRVRVGASTAARPSCAGLGFTPGWEARGAARGGFYVYDDPPPGPRACPARGTVHHVAWSSPTAEHEAWRERVTAAGGRPTPVIDRFYFRSIYFREPSGVLFEIATLGPGFTADEPLESLGRAALPPAEFEPLRDQLEQRLTPLPNPRARS